MLLALAVALVLWVNSLLLASLSLARQELFPAAPPAATALATSQAPPPATPPQYLFGQWTGKNGDVLRTGSTASIAPHDLSKGPTWTFQVPASPTPPVIRASPLIIEDQNVIVSTYGGDIFKFSRYGVLIWKISLEGILPYVPVMANGAIYTVRVDAVVIAINASSGIPLWESKIGHAVSGDTGSMTATDGLVVTATTHVQYTMGGQEEVVAVFAETGKVAWRYKPDSLVYNFLSAVYKGEIVFEDCLGTVYCLRYKDGKLLWKERPPARLFRNATTAGIAMDIEGNIYAAHLYDLGVGALTVRNIKDGALLWEKLLPLPANSGAAVAHIDGNQGGDLAVFVAVQDNPLPWYVTGSAETVPPKPGKAMALNASNGAVLWQYDFTPWPGSGGYGGRNDVNPAAPCVSDSFGNPAVDGQGVAYFPRDDGLVYAIHDNNHDGYIDSSAGEVTAYDLGKSFQASPAISDGMVAFATCGLVAVFFQ
mmetsp:Transcript_62246/g.115525  ORF Transcript_62246/g.115525 Transcript_62246/m.115525 type:complete len:481 (-) Transcript_62246:78-1520(-)